jgi:aspartyl-tRNA(Asn)/glutamyl-tRNA(Gln) amidotransferase subunit C
MLDQKEVLRLAKLARLNFDSNQINNFISQFQSILNMIDKIKDLDCTNIEPLKSINNENLLTRQDEVREGGLQKELLSNAPGNDASLAKKVECFIVPKVIE